MDTGVESLRSTDVELPEFTRAILASSPNGIVLLNAASRIQMLNDHARQLLGLKPDDVAIGRAWAELARTPAGQVDPLALASARGEQVTEGEFELPRADGVYRLSVRVTACVGARGVNGAVITFKDVPVPTGVLAARARADERRIWLERALKELPNAVYMIDLDDGRLIYENDMMQALVGRPLPIGATAQARACEVLIRDGVTGRVLDYTEYPSMRAARGEVVRECPLTWMTAHGPRDVSVTAHALPAGPGWRRGRHGQRHRLNPASPRATPARRKRGAFARGPGQRRRWHLVRRPRNGLRFELAQTRANLRLPFEGAAPERHHRRPRAPRRRQAGARALARRDRDRRRLHG